MWILGGAKVALQWRGLSGLQVVAMGLVSTLLPVVISSFVSIWKVTALRSKPQGPSKFPC